MSLPDNGWMVIFCDSGDTKGYYFTVGLDRSAGDLVSGVPYYRRFDTGEIPNLGGGDTVITVTPGSRTSSRYVERGGENLRSHFQLQLFSADTLITDTVTQL